MPLLEIGRIARAHGLAGQVVVDLVTDRLERLEPGSVLDAGERGLVVSSSQAFGRRFLVRFEGIDTRDEAERLRGVTLRAEGIDDSETWWVHDLIGSSVREASGRERGRVVAVVDNPASDLLELDGGALVPLTFVVDFVDGVVTVEVPPGLFDD